MRGRIQIDALVRGVEGTWNEDRIGEGRVFSVPPFDWVAVINSDGRQSIIYNPEVIGEPRPVNQRTDIPARFR